VLSRLRYGAKLYKKVGSCSNRPATTPGHPPIFAPIFTQTIVQEDAVCLWPSFVTASQKSPHTLAIWSRMGNYTWQQTHDLACRYAQYLVSLNVKPGDLIALYLMNSPEIMIWWLATFAVGCAPAMINYNISGDALTHCLKISGSKVLIADEDEGCLNRVREVEERIQGELGMRICVMNEETRGVISGLQAREPEGWYRKGMKGGFPMVLSYTRYDVLSRFFNLPVPSDISFCNRC
jgi:hypothetical protein